VLGHGGQGIVWHALEIAVVVVNVKIHLGIIWNPTPSLFDGLVRGKHGVVFESYLTRLWVGASGPWVRFDSMGFAELGRLAGEEGESRGRRRRRRGRHDAIHGRGKLGAVVGDIRRGGMRVNRKVLWESLDAQFLLV